MNLLLWTLQVILAIKLVTAAISHGPLQGRPVMQQALQKFGVRLAWFHWLVTLGLLFAMAGLLLPGVLGWSSWTTPAAAAGLALLLMVSIFFHVKSREKPKVFVSLVLFVFAVLVAWGRWVLSPF